MCGCEAHWDVNARCTCSCSSHADKRREQRAVPDPTTDDVRALEPLIRAAMAAGSMCAAERARDGLIDPLAPLGDAFGDFPAEFLRIRYLLVDRALARVRAEAGAEAIRSIAEDFEIEGFESVATELRERADVWERGESL